VGVLKLPQLPEKPMKKDLPYGLRFRDYLVSILPFPKAAERYFPVVATSVLLQAKVCCTKPPPGYLLGYREGLKEA
jgi:hypothetical protein